MDGTHLTLLCDRLAARLDDRVLTRFQLIDMATVLLVAQPYIHQGAVAQSGTDMDVLNTSLRWIRDHAQDALVADLRSEVAKAVDGAAQILGRQGSCPQPGCRGESGQEWAHA